MTDRERITLKLERTSEELAERRAEREQYSRERPDAEDLLTQGDHEGPYSQRSIMALLSTIAELKQRRDEQGLSLTDVSERSGLGRALLSRLENGKVLNPTMATLWRYAEAIGSQGTLTVEPLTV